MPNMNISKPHILDLPDELLAKIFKLAVPQPYGFIEPDPHTSHFWDTFPPQRHDPGFVAHLTLTCKRFYHNATPLNYLTITLLPMKPGPFLQRLQKLQGLLNTNPTLGQHWRHLKIALYQLSQTNDIVPEEIFTLLEDLLPFFRNLIFLSLVSLDLKNGLTGRLLQQATKHLSHLEEVEVLDTWNYFTDLASLSRHLNLPALKSFRLECLPASLLAPDDSSQSPPPPQLSELRVGIGLARSPVLKQLVHWPKNLSSFVLDYWVDPNVDSTINLPVIQSILSVHAPTLRKLALYGPFSDTRETSLDLSEFTALDTLTVSRRLLGNLSAVNYPDVGNLLAPKLRKFTIEILPISGAFHPSTELGFGQAEEDWVRSLAQDALGRSIKLEEICIIHSDIYEFEPWSYMFNFQHSYPWDHLETLKKEWRPKGIAITYNYLIMSKWQFENMPKFP